MLVCITRPLLTLLPSLTKCEPVPNSRPPLLNLIYWQYLSAILYIFIELVSIPPRLLGLIHGAIGIFQEDTFIYSIIGIDCDADTRRHNQLMSIKEGLTVRGLTTAACLWLVAAVGMAAGGGYLILAISATILALVFLVSLHHLERV